jgi:hypothetical protein
MRKRNAVLSLATAPAVALLTSSCAAAAQNVAHSNLPASPASEACVH